MQLWRGLGLLAFFLPFALVAQSDIAFRNLAATDLGDLYFTSDMVLSGNPPSTSGNIFRYSPGKPIEWFAPDWGPIRGTIDVSADGLSFVGTDLDRVLVAEQPGPFYYRTRANSRIATSAGLRLSSLSGHAQLSRNGRYALVTNNLSHTLLDLTTGASRIIEDSVATLRQAVANDGSVILQSRDFSELVLHRSSGNARFSAVQPYRPYASAAKVDGQASRIVYWYSLVTALEHRVLRTIEVATGRDTLLAEYDFGDYYPGLGDDESPQFWITNDGQQVVYLAAPAASEAPQVFVIRSDGSLKRQLTSKETYPEGFVRATVSPDGTTVFAISGVNKIVKIDTSSGISTEIVPRTPYVWLTFGGEVPGSLGILTGRGLNDRSTTASAYPLPFSLDGVSVKIDKIDAPLVSIEPGVVRFQIPLETPIGPARIQISSQSPFLRSPDGSTYGLTIRPWGLWFLNLGPNPADLSAGRAVHQEFQSLVTLDDPASPGEIVHFYVVGLGPTAPTVPTGEPAPFNPPAVVLTPIYCSIEDRTVAGERVPLQVNFAGLAPGMSGVYQVSVQLPKVFHTAPGQRYLHVGCHRADGNTVGTSLPVPGSA